MEILADLRIQAEYVFPPTLDPALYTLPVGTVTITLPQLWSILRVRQICKTMPNLNRILSSAQSLFKLVEETITILYKFPEPRDSMPHVPQFDSKIDNCCPGPTYSKFSTKDKMACVKKTQSVVKSVTDHGWNRDFTSDIGTFEGYNEDATVRNGNNGNGMLIDACDVDNVDDGWARDYSCEIGKTNEGWDVDTDLQLAPRDESPKPEAPCGWLQVKPRRNKSPVNSIAQTTTLQTKAK